MFFFFTLNVCILCSVAGCILCIGPVWLYCPLSLERNQEDIFNSVLGWDAKCMTNESSNIITYIWIKMYKQNAHSTTLS